MGRKWIFVLTVVLLLCIAPIAAAASYWDRMGSGFEREQIYSHVVRTSAVNVQHPHPQLTGAAAGAWQAQFNKKSETSQRVLRRTKGDCAQFRRGGD